MTIDEALRTLWQNPNDATAWDVIAAEVYHSLLAYVASLLLTFKVAPSEGADDIVNDVLLSFYRRLKNSTLKLASSAELHAYLRVSARNLLVDRYRSERRAEQLVTFLTLKFSVAFENEGDHFRAIFLNEIISKLPSKCAAMFKLFVTEDLTLAEIADRLEEPVPRLSSRWYRCLEHAKKLF